MNFALVEKPRPSAGFTLIEMMITVVVIAILAAVAYPSYNSYTIRAHRADAQQVMLDIRSKEETYLLDARAYTATIGTAPGLNISAQSWDCATNTAQCSNNYYTITVAV